MLGGGYTIPTLGCYDKFDDIDFNSLPNSFVIKCTHDSGGLYICRDKSTFDIDLARKKINRSLKNKFYEQFREWAYKDVKPRIIIEKYMEDGRGDSLTDYKFFCFDGKAKLMFIATDRNIGETKFDYYDLDFNHLDIVQHYTNSDKEIRKPKNFDKMIQLSEKITQYFKLKHARIDFYEVDGELYFGEITFYHFSGLQPFKPKEWDEKIGNLLVLDKKQ